MSQSSFTKILILTNAVLLVFATGFNSTPSAGVYVNAEQDLKLSVIAQERHFKEHGKYVSCATPLSCEHKLGGIKLTKSNELVYHLKTLEHHAYEDGFVAQAKARNSNVTFYYDSRTKTPETS